MGSLCLCGRFAIESWSAIPLKSLAFLIFGFLSFALQVDWILQYDPPCETTDYVHRVGRTARRGLHGSALIFLLPSELAYIPLLASHGLTPQALSLQSMMEEAAKAIPGSSKYKNNDEMGAVILQRRVETVVRANKPLMAAARQAFRSFVRAYATHSSDTKGIFKVRRDNLF
jgi:ATP-dependent RNA helicase DDX31/DBP7